jgi:hypothetical protein
MTDAQVVNLPTAPAPYGKRKIANATITGPVVEIQFSDLYGSAKLTIDTSKTGDNTRALLAAQGAASVIQTSYSAAEDPVAAATSAIDRMMSGDWRPGPPRGEPPMDPLVQAIAEHLAHETKKPYSPEKVLEEFIPAYQARHALTNISVARRRLRAHPDIAARVAHIEAARAKAASDRVKGTSAESLL